MRTATLLASLLLAGCGWPSVEVRRFCFSKDAVGLPPAPPVAGPVTFPAVSVPLELPPLLGSGGSLHLKLRLDEAWLIATTPGTDLSGIDSLDVIATFAGTPVHVARYQKAPGTPAPVTAILAQGEGVDVSQAAEPGQFSVALQATFNGQPAPAAIWDGKVKLCLYGKATVSP